MIKKCFYCRKKYEAYDKKGHHPHNINGTTNKYKRAYNSKTCSSKCSKLYHTKVRKLNNKKYNKIKNGRKDNKLNKE